jgi:cation transporter-like permease
MPDHRDRALIEEARTQRMRLGSALLHGRIDERRTVNDNVGRFVGSLIVAALACAVCVGISFVTDLLEKQAAEKQAQQNALVVTRVEERA